jgi:hypothetical protein
MSISIATLIRIAAACIAAVATAASANAQSSTFEAAGRDLTWGQTIYVTDLQGRTTKAQLTNLSAESIDLLVGGRPVEMRRSEVTRITERRGDSLWNGLLIGAAAGIGTAIVANQAFCGGNDTECSAIVWGAIGMPAIAAGTTIGGVADALVKQRVVVYQATPSDRRVTGGPTAGAGGAGMAVRVRF